LFPQINGYRFFLIHSEDKDMAAISAAMENGWSDEGMDVTSTQETLAKLLAVQNTYISAFQSIGALGLLLGTVGLAVVQVRSVLERRRELALMQAIGFSRMRVAQQLLCESIVFLVGGLLIGIVAAAIAIVPYMLSGNGQLNVVEPIVLLSIVLVVGLAASTFAVATALRQPIVPNLQ
jgi:ABC-type antimicrobial peptide transport system permease subunit